MKELNQYQRYLVHEFVEDYQDGLMSRRDMTRRVLHITGGVAAAATMLTRLGVTVADAQDQPMPTPTEPLSPLTVPADDPGVLADEISFEALEGEGATIMAYQARPAGGSMSATPAATPVADGLPLVLVCHENRGLTDHLRDVTRRVARAGHVPCAVDLLSREGGAANVAYPAKRRAETSRLGPWSSTLRYRGADSYAGTSCSAASAMSIC